MNNLRDPTWTEPLPIFAFVIEHPEGLIIVDTGETARVTERGYFPWWHPYYRFAVREWVRPEEEIGPQLQALGFDPTAVRWVLLTHLYTDHAGGLAHFPHAEHLLGRHEYEYAHDAGGLIRGFLPNRWPAWFNPTLIDMQPVPLGPFSRSYQMTQAGDIHIVPTPSHTPGHLSVVVRTTDVAYFLAGDASYTQASMLAGQIDGVSKDRDMTRRTLATIQDFCGATPTVYLPAHDPDTPDRLTNRQLALAPDTPAAPIARPPGPRIAAPR